MNLRRLFDRDAARERQDSAAPLAMPVAELRTVHPGRELRDRIDQIKADYEAVCRSLCIAKGIDPDEIISDAGHVAWQHMGHDAKLGMIGPDAPIVISLATLRSCRPDGIARPDPIETARMVETVAQRTYESATGLLWCDATTRVRKRVRDGVRRGMQEVGVVR